MRLECESGQRGEEGKLKDIEQQAINTELSDNESSHIQPNDAPEVNKPSHTSWSSRRLHGLTTC